MDGSAVTEHEEVCKGCWEMEHAMKKLAKENEKPRGRGQGRRSRPRVVEDDFARLSKLRGSGKATFKLNKALEMLVVEAIDRLEKKIKAFKLQMVDRSIDRSRALNRFTSHQRASRL